jgi:GrpB-like predicted nucleotidyltransferase (UPF0157 family)
MIGLEKGIVRVAPHHPSWHDAFEQERHVLQKQIGSQVLDIQHVGSTAVPGLGAKPIIDMAAAVVTTALVSVCRQRLCNLGYIDRGDAHRRAPKPLRTVAVAQRRFDVSIHSRGVSA